MSFKIDSSSVKFCPSNSTLAVLYLLQLQKHSIFIEHVSIKLFADDCKLFCVLENPDSPNVLQHALNQLIQWSNKSQIGVQPNKCFVLHVGHNNPRYDYSLGDVPLKKVEHARDLGVTMSADLKFNKHIEAICRSANVTANLILRTFKCKRPSFMMQLFNTFVRSKIEYASPIWNPQQIGLINRLESIQRRFTKRLPGLVNRPYVQRLLFLHAQSLELRRLHLDLIFLFKILHGLFDFDYGHYFQFHDTVTRGHTWKLKTKNVNTTLRQNSFAVRIIGPWNAVAVFKRKLHEVNFSRFLRGVGHEV